MCLLAFVQDNKCFRELKEFLRKVCSEKNIANNLEMLLEKKAQDVGLLVSQRVMNLPPQLLPPLYDGLFDEVSWAIEDEVRSCKLNLYVTFYEQYKYNSFKVFLFVHIAYRKASKIIPF